MTKILVEILDKKLNEIQTVLTVQNKLLAIREFSDLCKNPESKIAKHPEDYKLIQVGVLDGKKGIIDTEISDIMEATEVIETNETKN